jgi:hypothetical protein
MNGFNVTAAARRALFQTGRSFQNHKIEIAKLTRELQKKEPRVAFR